MKISEYFIEYRAVKTIDLSDKQRTLANAGFSLGPQ